MTEVMTSEGRVSRAVAAREKAEHEYFDPLIAAINEEFGT